MVTYLLFYFYGKGKYLDRSTAVLINKGKHLYGMISGFKCRNAYVIHKSIGILSTRILYVRTCIYREESEYSISTVNRIAKISYRRIKSCPSRYADINSSVRHGYFIACRRKLSFDSTRSEEINSVGA